MVKQIKNAPKPKGSAGAKVKPGMPSPVKKADLKNGLVAKKH
jgi:hypothetical protein